MGFFKVFKYVAAGIAATAAAPVVLGLASATGVMAAATGAAAAVGAAATGALTAAGTAVASTAVGSAAISAATTGAAAIGTAVGSAAGAVGLTSVAAATSTTAGAAAVGTISTSVAIGAHQGLSAFEKINKAKEIVNSAKYKYEQADSQFKSSETKINAKLKSMANIKKRVAEKLIEINNIFDKLENKTDLFISNAPITEFDKDTRINIEGYSMPVQEWAKGIATAYASGNFLGIALTGGITSTITTAGTGAAMSSLSGAAATNATLAALGGGTLASGGLGMAGGALMAKGLVFAPAFAIGGLLVNNKADEALEKAGEIDSKANEAVNKLKQISDYYALLGSRVSEMQKNILETENIFNRFFPQIQFIVDKELNVRKWTRDQVYVAFAAFSLSRILEFQCKTNFIKQGTDIETLDKNNIISESDVKKLTYTNIPSQYEHIGTTVEIIEEADKANIYA